MHSYFKKGLILAAFVGIFGAGSGIHAKAAELPVQTGNPAVNADGLLRQVQKMPTIINTWKSVMKLSRLKTIRRPKKSGKKKKRNPIKRPKRIWLNM